MSEPDTCNCTVPPCPHGPPAAWRLPADELVPVEQLFELQQELREARAVIDNLHNVLSQAGIRFRCNCGSDACIEMRVYLDTVKTPAQEQHV